MELLLGLISYQYIYDVTLLSLAASYSKGLDSVQPSGEPSLPPSSENYLFGFTNSGTRGKGERSRLYAIAQAHCNNGT